MANCLAPGYCVIHYTSNGNPHKLTIPVQPSGSGDTIAFVEKAGAIVDAQTEVDALLTLLAPVFHTADTFDSFEVFTQADCESAPVFQRIGTPTVTAGTGSSADVPWSQVVLTFKDAQGQRGKFQVMEANQPVDQKVAISALTGHFATIAAYLIGSTSWALSRNNHYLTTGLNFVTKTNDRLRKAFLNP